MNKSQILSELKLTLLELWIEHVGDLERDNDGEGRSELEGKNNESELKFILL